MSHNINEVKSQHELNDGKRKSDVLIEAIEKCEVLGKENKVLQEKLDIAIDALESIEIEDCYFTCIEEAKDAIAKIKELNK